MFKNSIDNEYIRVKNLLENDKLQKFYNSISMTYLPIFIDDLHNVDIQIIDKVTTYLFRVKIQEVTYEDIRHDLIVSDYSSYVIEEVIFCIKLILFSEENPIDWTLSQIKIKPLIFFLYLCYYYTSFAFNLIKLDKYEFISFYEKFFAYNFLKNQYVFVQFFSCMTEMNKKVV